MSPFDLVKAASGGDDLNPKCKGAALASDDAIPGKKNILQIACVLNECTDT